MQIPLHERDHQSAGLEKNTAHTYFTSYHIYWIPVLPCSSFALIFLSVWGFLAVNLTSQALEREETGVKGESCLSLSAVSGSPSQEQEPLCSAQSGSYSDKKLVR